MALMYFANTAKLYAHIKISFVFVEKLFASIGFGSSINIIKITHKTVNYKHNNNQADIIEAFNSTSRYLDDLILIMT